MTSLRQRLIEWTCRLCNLAVNTQESYIQQVSVFARHFKKVARTVWDLRRLGAHPALHDQ